MTLTLKCHSNGPQRLLNYVVRKCCTEFQSSQESVNETVRSFRHASNKLSRVEIT